MNWRKAVGTIVNWWYGVAAVAAAIALSMIRTYIPS